MSYWKSVPPQLQADYVDFNTSLSAPSYLAGRMYWDTDHQTLACHMGQTDVTLQIGQEQHIRVVNKTGSTLLNGSVCYVSGAQGNRPTVTMADADLETADATIGVITADILNNEEGYLTVFGIVHGINTSGYTTGDELYISSTAGQMTKTAPATPKHRVRVGYALNSTNNGSIFVSIFSIGELSDIHDVSISSLTDGDVLRYDQATGTWKNAALGASITHSSLSGLTTGDAGHTQFVLKDGKAGGQTIYGDVEGGGDLNLNSTASVTKGQIFVGGTAMTVDESLGTTTLGSNADMGYNARLHIFGKAPSSTQWRGIACTNANTNNTNKGAAVIVGPRYAIANNPFNVLGHWDNNTARTVYVGGGGWNIPDATTINMYAVAAYDENAGVSGNLRAQLTATTFSLQNSCGLTVAGATQLNNNLTVGTHTLVVDNTNQRVGINYTPDEAWFEVCGQPSFLGDLGYHVLLRDKTGMAANNGTGLMVSHKAVTGSSTYYGAGGFMVRKENGTSGNTSSYFTIHTRLNGSSVAEVARLNSAGNLGIGTSVPNSNARIHVTKANATDGTAPTAIHIQNSSNPGTWTTGAQLAAFQMGHGGTATITPPNPRVQVALEAGNTGASASHIGFYTDEPGFSDLRRRASIVQRGIALPSAPEFGLLVGAGTSSPTFGWKDLLGNLNSRETGSGNPAWATFIGNIKQYQWSTNDSQQIEFHLPHDYASFQDQYPNSANVVKTDIFFHVHYSLNSYIASGALTFEVEFTYAKGHGQGYSGGSFATTKTYTLTATPISGGPSQYQHNVAEFQMSTDGGSATQLDRSLLEPDGLILVRVKLTGNTIVTGGAPNDKKPFIHFCDIHYQSNQMTTKNKAPNFYT